MSDRYQIISTIGPCGCGTVSRGWDNTQNRAVVITRYPVQGPALHEFTAKARLLSGLRNSKVVMVHHSSTDESGGLLATEDIKGKSLAAQVAHGALTEDEFVALARQALEGLVAAHTAGLWHLNLQPANVMLPWNSNHEFLVRLTDFDLAPSAAPHASQRAVQFLAPEQLGQGFVDQRTDLYALGTILYYALTQKPPFDGADSSQIIIAHLHHKQTPLHALRPDMPASMCGWVERLMSQEAKDRPASATEALRIFKAIVQQETPVSAALVVEDEAEEEVAAPEVEPEEAGEAGVAALTEEEEAPEAETAVAAVAEEEAYPEPEPEAVLEADAEIEAEPVAELVAEAEPVYLTKDASRYPAAYSSNPPPRRKNSALTLIIAAFVVTAFGMLGFVSWVKYSQRGERQQRFEELTKSAKPVGSDLDVRILFDYLDDPTTREAAAAVLSKLQGGDYIDPMIVEHLKKIRQNTACATLTEVIGKRKITAAFPEVMPLVHDHFDEVRKAAWKALGQITLPSHLPEMIEGIRNTSPRERTIIGKAITTAIDNAKDRNQAIQLVQKVYQDPAGDAPSRALLLDVLVHVGGEGTLPIVTSAIADPAVPVRLAAITVLADYPTHDPLPAITSRFAIEEDAGCRAYLLLAAKELIDKPGPFSQEALALHAQSLYSNAKTPNEKDKTLVVVGRVMAEGTAAFYERYAAVQEDPELKREALGLSRVIKSRLSKTIVISPSATTTTLEGAAADYDPDSEMARDDGDLHNWKHETDWAAWIIQMPKNGTYEITMRQAHGGDELGTYEVLLAGQSLVTSVVKTANDKDFQGFIVGEVTISQPGTYRLMVRPKTLPAEGDLFRVRSVGIKLKAG